MELHSSSTLEQSQEELLKIVESNSLEEGGSFLSYVSRLLEVIQTTIAERRVQKLLSCTNNDNEVEYLDSKEFGFDKVPSPKNGTEDVKPVTNDKSEREHSPPPKPMMRSPNRSSHSIEKARGFKSRIKTRVRSLKAKQLFDPQQHKKQVLEEDKYRRRVEAKRRMKKRNDQRREEENKREKRRQYKEEKERLQQEKLAEIEREIDVAVDSTGISKNDSEGDKAKVFTEIASKATILLEQCEAVYDESDSDTSVESHANTSTIMGEEVDDEFSIEQETDNSRSTSFEAEPSSDSLNQVVESNFVIEQSEASISESNANEINMQSSFEKDVIVETMKGHDNTTTLHIESFMPPISESLQFLSNQVCEDIIENTSTCDAGIEWSPWQDKDCTSTSSPSQNEECTDYKFTKVFPTFRSLFTAFSTCKTNDFDRQNDLIERACLEYQIQVNSSVEILQMPDRMLFCTKSSRSEVSSIISDVCNDEIDHEWREVKASSEQGNCWNLMWTWKAPKINIEHLLIFQRVSRFQSAKCLTRKDMLKKRLEIVATKISPRYRDEWNIMPLTFALPKEFTSFLAAFSSNGRRSSKDEQVHPNFWIMKPVGMSRGRGISIINDIAQVKYSTPTVIQRYLPNPLLFDGYKFDLRLYCLVTSFTPLEAFLYREGFARFGSRKYTNLTDDMSDLQMHLTNSSIQKNFSQDLKGAHPSSDAGVDGGDNKVRISWLWSRLKPLGVDIEEVWEQIKKLCIKTLIVTADEIPPQPNSFELFGFDIILDSNERPWLIEVNSCPALSRESELDFRVKEKLISDVLKVVDPPQYNRDALLECCRKRLYEKKRASSKFVSEKELLEEDLKKVFNNKMPRQYGEHKDDTGFFDRIAPSDVCSQLQEQVKKKSK